MPVNPDDIKVKNRKVDFPHHSDSDFYNDYPQDDDAGLKKELFKGASYRDAGVSDKISDEGNPTDSKHTTVMVMAHGGKGHESSGSGMPKMEDGGVDPVKGYRVISKDDRIDKSLDERGTGLKTAMGAGKPFRSPGRGK